jgi:hypothetical protein
MNQNSFFSLADQHPLWDGHTISELEMSVQRNRYKEPPEPVSKTLALKSVLSHGCQDQQEFKAFLISLVTPDGSRCNGTQAGLTSFEDIVSNLYCKKNVSTVL